MVNENDQPDGESSIANMQIRELSSAPPYLLLASSGSQGEVAESLEPRANDPTQLSS